MSATLMLEYKLIYDPIANSGCHFLAVCHDCEGDQLVSGVGKTAMAAQLNMEDSMKELLLCKNLSGVMVEAKRERSVLEKFGCP